MHYDVDTDHKSLMFSDDSPLPQSTNYGVRLAKEAFLVGGYLSRWHEESDGTGTLVP
jgi:hypothetical protein